VDLNDLRQEDFSVAVYEAARVARVPRPQVTFESCGNVAALVTDQGIRTIACDWPWLLERLEVVPERDRFRALLGVAAHEIAHFEKLGHQQSPIENELFADRFAGDVLRLMGVPTMPIKTLLAHLKKTPDHPEAADRIAAVGVGQAPSPLSRCVFRG